MRVCFNCRYPELLTSTDAKDLPDVGKKCASWRGGGFRDDCKAFFVARQGKYYRVPGFLATSLRKSKAMFFIGRADKAYPRILWCILVSPACSQLAFVCSRRSVSSSLCPRHDSLAPPYNCTTVRVVCSWITVDAQKASSDASMPASFSKQRYRTRWNSSTPPFLLSRYEVCN